jgi:hypothetical protein
VPYIADRVKESTTSTGTGAITLSGVAATGGYQTLATAFGSSSRVVGYAIVDTANSAFEVGKGTFNGTTGLTRDTVRTSSNGNALVNFAAGTKDVFITASAELIDNGNTGMQYAAGRGYLMP